MGSKVLKVNCGFAVIGHVASLSLVIWFIEVILERNGLYEPHMDFLYDIHKTKGLKRFETNTLEELKAIKLTRNAN